MRAGLAETGNGATNQPWIIAPQFSDIKSEPGDRTGLQVLHEYVGVREHCAEQRNVLTLAEIEHHRLFAAIEPDEITALAVNQIVVAAGEIALETLDLDDARAGIRQPAGAHRRRDRLFQRDDEQAGKWSVLAQYDLGSPKTCSAI